MNLLNTELPLSEVADFGDRRLSKRLEKIHEDLCNNKTSPITSSCQNKHQAKGAYRFFSNSKVNYTSIISAHLKTLSSIFEGLNEDIPEGEPSSQRILQLDDTTEFDYTGKRSSDNLGVLNYEHRKGIYLHNSLLVSDKGVPFGVFKQTMWSRDPNYLGNSEARRSLPLPEKESFRWYDHYKSGEQMCSQLCSTIPNLSNLEWVYIADREADFMELLAARSCENMHMVIRSQYNRNLASSAEDGLKLWDKVGSQDLAETYEIKIIHPKTQKPRKAKLEVRFCPVTLDLVNAHPSGGRISPVKMNVIEVKEIDAPSDIKKPIKWILLTTLPVQTALQARQVIKYYVLRWLIERFFYLLKTGGADLEQLQLATQHRLENAISTYSIAMIEIMKLRYLAENQPDTPIDEVGVTPQEHEALYKVVHQYYPQKVKYQVDEIPTIKEFCVVMGMLSGFYPSKRQPLPGIKVLTRALDKFRLIIEIFSITNMSKN